MARVKVAGGWRDWIYLAEGGGDRREAHPAAEPGACYRMRASPTIRAPRLIEVQEYPNGTNNAEDERQRELYYYDSRRPRIELHL